MTRFNALRDALVSLDESLALALDALCEWGHNTPFADGQSFTIRMVRKQLARIVDGYPVSAGLVADIVERDQSRILPYGTK